MSSLYQLHLEHLPWPISVLKFNGAVSALRAGDVMIATVQDMDVVGNICQLLGSQPDLRYEIQKTDAAYRIQVVKGKPNRWDNRA